MSDSDQFHSIPVMCVCVCVCVSKHETKGLYGECVPSKKQLCHSIERKEGEEKGKETRVEEAVEYMSFPQRKEKKEERKKGETVREKIQEIPPPAST